MKTIAIVLTLFCASQCSCADKAEYFKVNYAYETEDYTFHATVDGKNKYIHGFMVHDSLAYAQTTGSSEADVWAKGVYWMGNQKDGLWHDGKRMRTDNKRLTIFNEKNQVEYYDLTPDDISKIVNNRKKKKLIKFEKLVFKKEKGTGSKKD